MSGPARLSRLPVEAEVQATPRAVAVSAAAALLLFALVDLAAVAALRRAPPDPTSRLIAAKWDLLEACPTVDLLVLGDSSGNQGLSPARLGERLSGRALNLCTVGDLLLVADAWMLEEYLERHPPPRAVFVCHVHDVWQRSPSAAAIAAVPRPWGFWSARAPAVELGAADRLRVALQRWVPLATRSRASLLALVGLGERDLRPLDPDGFMPSRRSAPARVEASAAAHLASPAAPALSAANLDALRRLGALSERHGFALHLVQGPLHERLAADAGFRARLAAQRALVAEAVRPFPRARLLLWDAPAAFRGDELDDSADHLQEPAALRFTDEVARAAVEAR